MAQMASKVTSAEADEVAHEVANVIAARLHTVDRKVRPSDSLDSLGLGSLDVLEIAFELEQRFDIEIPFNANTAFEFDTVGALAGAIERLIAEKSCRK
jgi:acyl carrier protein